MRMLTANASPRDIKNCEKPGRYERKLALKFPDQKVAPDIFNPL